MAEWLVERGIGEDRAILVEAEQVLAARADWPGKAAAGLITDAILIARTAGSPRGTVRLPSGEEALVSGLPREASEGSTIRVAVTRATMAESGRYKRAQCRPSPAACRPAPTLAEALAAEGQSVSTIRTFPAGLWEEAFALGWSGAAEFSGGSLTLSATPAMTLIDVDGHLKAPELALSATRAIAEAIRQLDLGGSIGIDFPTLAEKSARRAIDEALDLALTGWPHERTAMNGFGFVQLVARLERPSLLHRFAQDRTGAAARLLLRQAERVEAPGTLLLTLHPAVRAAILPAWEQELARRSGRRLEWREDSALALDGGFAQAITQ